MADFTEKLIEHVKKYVLYDMSHVDYKNIRIKNKVWDEIAKEMGEHTGDDLKKRWKNLRDCFSKHIRSEKTQTGQAAKVICRYKVWPWAQHMEVFKPFLQFAQTESNIIATDDIQQSPIVVREGIETYNIQNESIETFGNGSDASTGTTRGTTEQQRSKRMPYNSNSQQKRKAVENPAHTSVDKVIEYFNKRHSNVENNCDSIHLTFQGYAASVKKLSSRRQAVIKYKIAKIIMEEELAQEEENQMESRPGTSFSNYSQPGSSAPNNSALSSPMSNIMPTTTYDNSSSSTVPNSSNRREDVSQDDYDSAATWCNFFSHTNT